MNANQWNTYLALQVAGRRTLLQVRRFANGWRTRTVWVGDKVCAVGPVTPVDTYAGEERYLMARRRALLGETT